MHDFIQTVMGWEDSHFFGFSFKGTTISEEHYQQLKLANFLSSPNDEFEYHYDLGDDWHYVIRL